MAETAPSTNAMRVFSGMQPTDELHLGNYLGAMKRWVAMQDDADCIYCIVDLHAITMWQDPVKLRAATRELAATYIAAGIDPVKHIIFNQSQVHEHAELAWIFNCVARMGWLNRMTQFKDKAGKNRENASVGLFTYPTLMAADILTHRATHVPVGDDQKQHLELTRDIAQKFNHDFKEQIIAEGFASGDFFPITEPIIGGPAPRVMSLRDGSKKMSKSDPSDMSRISLFDDAETIAKKFRKAKTDADGLPSDIDGLDGRPEALNLVTLYAALAEVSKEDVLAEFGGQGFGAFKPALAELAVAKVAPIGQEAKRLLDDVSEIDAILREGAGRASQSAAKTLKHVKNIVGFVS